MTGSLDGHDYRCNPGDGVCRCDKFVIIDLEHDRYGPWPWHDLAMQLSATPEETDIDGKQVTVGTVVE
jgi:hypothetical protein